MDSTRGGPLSNLILILPLLVVPALVMFRPVEPDSGVSSADVAAGESMDSFEDLLADEFPDVVDDPVQPDAVHSPPTTRGTSAGMDVASADELLNGSMSDQPASLSDPSPFFPLNRAAATPPEPRPPAHEHQSPDSPTAESDQATDLARLGVARSIWFTPGQSGRVGFAAFVPTTGDSVSYRFAAIAPSRQAAMDDVVRQIQTWRRSQATTPGQRVP